MQDTPTSSRTITLAFLCALTLWTASAQAQLANSTWPMFMHDLQHTGRASVNGPSTNNVKVIWSYKAKSRIQTSPTLGANNTVYIGAGFAPLCAINATTGVEKWCSVGGGDAAISSPTVASDGTIFIGDRKNTARKVQDNGISGLVLWEEKIFLDGDVRSSLAIDLSGNAVYGSCGCLSAGIVHAFNPTNGDILWNLHIGNSTRNSAPAIDTSNDASRRGTIYIGTTDGFLVALTSRLSPPAAGQVKWSAKAGGILRNNSSPSIADDGTIYIGTSTGVTAVSPTGAVLWQFAADDKSSVSATPAIGSNGTIYFGSQKKTFYAVNPNGTLKWKIPGLDGEFIASAAIGANGKIYAAGGKKVYCFDDNGGSGSIRWTSTFSKPVQWSSPAIGPENELYVGVTDKYVYRLEAN
jgi:outer membrane protein assembly factor BamB